MAKYQGLIAPDGRILASSGGWRLVKTYLTGSVFHYQIRVKEKVSKAIVLGVPVTPGYIDNGPVGISVGYGNAEQKAEKDLNFATDAGYGVSFQVETKASARRAATAGTTAKKKTAKRKAS